MNVSGSVRVESLNKENYDTWRMQMEALLIKNDAWEYVEGTKIKPKFVEADAATAQAAQQWDIQDRKARSDIILSIGKSELKQVKGCATAREVWLKLESIYQSKGPARKATFLKQLVLQRMSEGEDVREHMNRFFDAVDKLKDMGQVLDADLLSILLLYSLPLSFQSFRVAIKSRDDLPAPDMLKVKIVEEADARKSEMRGGVTNAMIAGNFNQKGRARDRYKNDKNSSERQDTSKMKCFRCKKIGHKASQCKVKLREDKQQQNAKNAENFLFCTSVVSGNEKDSDDVSFQATDADRNGSWCLDSGCSSHICKNSDRFSDMKNVDAEKLQLASSAWKCITSNTGQRCYKDIEAVGHSVRP